MLHRSKTEGDGTALVLTLKIKTFTDGSLAVEYPVGDADYCLKVLDHAKDAIRNQIRPKGSIIIPSHDVSLPTPVEGATFR